MSRWMCLTFTQKREIVLRWAITQQQQQKLRLMLLQLHYRICQCRWNFVFPWNVGCFSEWCMFLSNLINGICILFIKWQLSNRNSFSVLFALELMSVCYANFKETICYSNCAVNLINFSCSEFRKWHFTNTTDVLLFICIWHFEIKIIGNGKPSAHPHPANLMINRGPNKVNGSKLENEIII